MNSQTASPAQGDLSAERNSPLAPRMAIIAFLNGNITIACMWGTFSVLLISVERRLGIGREISTLGVPLINLTTAIMAPVVGMLAARYSLRLVMLAGAMLSTAGYVLLAFGNHYPLYLAAYGLLLGPGMAAGVVLPPTLVTRWFHQGRGRAMGIVQTPLMVMLMPLAATWALQSYGLVATYLMLAALSSVAIVANLFIVSHPPPTEATADSLEPISSAETALASPAFGVGALLRSPTLWGLTIAAVSTITATVVLSANMVPLAQSWKMSASAAATLLTCQSLAGIAGASIMGWVADRIGGARTLAIIVFDGALLWIALMFHPPFALAAVLVGLWGLHSAGSVPVLGIALSDTFGREGFSRAYGLVNLLNLPFSVLCVPLAALAYARTGSYTLALAGQLAFFVLCIPLALLAARKKQLEVAA